MKVLVDMMSVVFISFYATVGQMRREGRNEFTEKDVPFFLHFLFTKLNLFFSTYGKLDICWDGNSSLEWRRSLYPGYKLNRQARKKEPTYQILMSTLPKIEEGLSFYPCRQIQINNAEADDIIFALAEKYIDEHILVISGDGDLGQLINFFGDRVEVYHPIKKQYINPSPLLLEEKTIVGDISDNIKGLPGIGPKTFEKMMKDKKLYNEKISKGNNRELYNNILKIVDLRVFPWRQQILDKEQTIKYNNFQPNEIELFFWDNSLKNLLERWSSTKNNIGRMTK